MNAYTWWNDPGTVDEVTIISKHLVDQFPEHKIISVGQSPAWITLGAGMIRRLRGEEANIGLIPFTGNYMDAGPDEKVRMRRDGKTESGLARTFKRAAGKEIDPEVAARFQKMLVDLKLSPDDLAEGMGQGKKYLFCDLTITGKGLASFMSEWSIHASSETCKFLGTNLEALAFTPKGQADKTHFKINSDLIVPIHNYVMGFERYEKLVYTDPTENRTGPDSTRLAAMYQLYANSLRPAGLHPLQNGPIIKDIKASLHANIQAHEQGESWSKNPVPMTIQPGLDIAAE